MSEVLLGYVCFIFATVLFLSTTYMANCWILWPLFEEHGLFWTAGFFLIIFNLSFLASMVTYMSACFRDPGYVPKMNPPPEFPHLEVYNKTCAKCKDDRWKPPRAYHCKTCQRCVFKMDHHCVWINNCVGALNGKFFWQFVWSACVFNVLFFIIEIVALLNVCGLIGSSPLVVLDRIEPHHVGAIITLVIYCVFAMAFSYFTWEFIDDFSYGVYRNQTTVENWKEIFGTQWDDTDLRAFYMGYRKLEWFLPTVPKETHNYLERTYTREEIQANKFKNEADQLVVDPVYDRYFLVKKQN